MLPGKAKTSVYKDAQGCSSAARVPHSGRKYFLQSFQSSRRRQGSHLDASLASVSSPISVPAPRVCVPHSAAWHTPFRASSRDFPARKDDAHCRLFAGVDIAAPVAVVWDSLTDYDGLGNFIPGLAENRCLERRQQGAKLLQVGEQEIAFGAKFRARVVLNIEEYWSGVPASMCEGSSNDSSGGNGRQLQHAFLVPRCPLLSQAHDITFSSIEGDFQAFRGIWRIKEGERGKASSRLSYSLYVRPQIWLPVRLVQSRIESEIKANLAAVRRHAEGIHAKQGSTLKY